jgi:hypothetical protein
VGRAWLSLAHLAVGALCYRHCASTVIGIALQRGIRHRPLTAVGQVSALLVLIAAALLATFTGYLVSDGNPIGEETRNRFIVVHYFFLPGVISLLLAAWFMLFFRRISRSLSGTRGHDTRYSVLRTEPYAQPGQKH